MFLAEQGQSWDDVQRAISGAGQKPRARGVEAQGGNRLPGALEPGHLLDDGTRIHILHVVQAQFRAAHDEGQNLPLPGLASRAETDVTSLYQALELEQTLARQIDLRAVILILPSHCITHIE